MKSRMTLQSFIDDKRAEKARAVAMTGRRNAYERALVRMTDEELRDEAIEEYEDRRQEYGE